jgi:hypothetical protein
LGRLGEFVLVSFAMINRPKPLYREGLKIYDKSGNPYAVVTRDIVPGQVMRADDFKLVFGKPLIEGEYHEPFEAFFYGEPHKSHE